MVQDGAEVERNLHTKVQLSEAEFIKVIEEFGVRLSAEIKRSSFKSLTKIVMVAYPTRSFYMSTLVAGTSLSVCTKTRRRYSTA